jgi:hypothetical protein
MTDHLDAELDAVALIQRYSATADTELGRATGPRCVFEIVS